jgi:type IV pilus assembly protein PilO
MQRTFGAMLRQLPGQTEVENLLVDIAQSALAAGLEQELFQPRSEITRDFYAELPITMVLTGGFHQFATFASNVAALPRIVTLHDIKITPRGTGRGSAGVTGSGPLTMEITARTYRYIDESAQERAAPAPRRGRR